MTRRFWALALVSAACGAKPGPPEWRGQRVGVERHTIAPSTEQAQRYNDTPRRGPVVEDPLARVALDAVGTAMPELVEDERLSRACAAIAQVAGEEGNLPSLAVEFAIAHEGIIEPQPQLMVVEVTPGTDGPLAEEITRRLPDVLGKTRFARIGAGTAPSPRGDTRILVVAFQESWIDAEPLPRELALGRSVIFRARIKPPYREPHLYVTSPKGTVAERPLRATDGQFRTELRCDDKGVHQVEIVAEDEHGSPSVVANFPIWCSERPPTKVVVPFVPLEGPVYSTSDVERRIFALTNEDRKRQGLEPFVWDDLAAEIARRHAVEMATDQYVAHRSPKTGFHGDRAAKAGLASPMLLENVALAYSAEEAHLGFMGSPGHRANVLHPDATHLGIGVAFGPSDGPRRPRVYVTELFFRVPPDIDKDYARLQVLDAVQTKRKGAGRARMTPDPRLQEIAQGYADAAAAGRKADGQAWAKRKIAELSGYTRVLTLMGIAGEAVHGFGDNVLEGGQRIGIGIGQGAHPSWGPKAIFVVILIGG